MKKLYLHIGAPKTGTSAIQHFLLRNREALAAQGVLYPQGGMLKSAHHLIGAAIHPLRAKRLGKTTPAEALSDAMSKIHSEIAARAPHTLVISTEYLWGRLSPVHISRLLESFHEWEIHVVVYLRRQDLLAQSLYVQAVKTGTALSFEEWVESAVESGKGGFFFYNVLTSWRDCGVPLTVDVRLYEKGQIGSDVCADFMKLISPTPLAGLSSDIGLVNTAPDMETTELMRLSSSILQNKETAERVRRGIMKHSPPRALFAPLQYLTPDQVGIFMLRFAEDNQKVAREFVGRDDGVLFYEPLPTGPVTAAADFDSRSLLKKLIELLPLLLQVPATAPGKAKLAEQPKASDADKERERRIRKRLRKKTLEEQAAAQTSG